mmetsp:Transcript_16369/g.37875  ORF Transcript_16369/g.37875 Transcript_16369/m.37875 type:complete len:354 (+) Transcript_16369:371-1432(+)
METQVATADDFKTRVTRVCGGSYRQNMRRSLQSLALYEADRCLASKYSGLRPFQRKFALLAATKDILGTLEWLNPSEREEVMYRTNSSKDDLPPDLAWRRMKVVSREIASTILPKAQELLGELGDNAISHNDFCDLLLQRMYEESTGKSTPHHKMFEFNHNNTFPVYRIYYKGISIDSKLWDPIVPENITVPDKKPENWKSVRKSNRVDESDRVGVKVVETFSLKSLALDTSPALHDPDMSDDIRRAKLHEVKEHMELLAQFEGIIPEEELIQRKKALYLALPPVPLPQNTNNRRKSPPEDSDSERQSKKKAHSSMNATKPSGTDPIEPLPQMDEEDWESVQQPEPDFPTVRI